MHIVGKAASASEETKILFAPHRLTYAIRHGARRVHAPFSATHMTRSPAGWFVSDCYPLRY
jgi:hypothetical protein